MPVLVARNQVVVSNTDPLIVETLGANNAQITIAGVSCFVSLAYRPGEGQLGSFGQEERWSPTIVNISNEPISGVRIRSAVPGQSATVDVSLAS